MPDHGLTGRGNALYVKLLAAKWTKGKGDGTRRTFGGERQRSIYVILYLVPDRHLVTVGGGLVDDIV